VPYKESFELNELGFNEPCFDFYDDDKELFYASKNDEKIHIGEGLKAPLWQQAFRWFRKTHQIGFYIWKKDEDVFKIVLERLSHNSYFFNDEFKTHEEAELQCVIKLIEIVKSRKQNNNGN
jgi:hypothetical protein